MDVSIDFSTIICRNKNNVNDYIYTKIRRESINKRGVTSNKQRDFELGSGCASQFKKTN